MSLFLNQTEAANNLTTLAPIGYNSSTLSGRSSIISALALFSISIVAGIVGTSLARFTEGRIQLNRLILYPIRQGIHNTYAVLADPIIDRVSSLINLLPPVRRVASSLERAMNPHEDDDNDDDTFIAAFLLAPVLEEIVFRFPLLAASTGMATFLEIGSSIGNSLELLLSVMLSIGFTYIHGIGLDAGRALSLFVGGLFLSYIVLEQGSGLGNTILIHFFYNFLIALLRVIPRNFSRTLPEADFERIT